ncbi:MAG: hypothetical protein CMO81_05245 [Waddliaceae bacterium]|nr:hypothetical protein [Waddliaceae bacterium]|tara:strand:+ start:90 stop:569 length:480 start_codon:yes stop_codon:yes gene_type:complete
MSNQAFDDAYRAVTEMLELLESKDLEADRKIDPDLIKRFNQLREVAESMSGQVRKLLKEMGVSEEEFQRQLRKKPQLPHRESIAYERLEDLKQNLKMRKRILQLAQLAYRMGLSEKGMLRKESDSKTKEKNSEKSKRKKMIQRKGKFKRLGGRDNWLPM